VKQKTKKKKPALSILRKKMEKSSSSSRSRKRKQRDANLMTMRVFDFFLVSHRGKNERRFFRTFFEAFPFDIFIFSTILSLHIFNFVIPSVSLSHNTHVNREIKGTRRAGDTLRIRTENKRWGERVYIYIFSPRVKARPPWKIFFFVFRA